MEKGTFVCTCGPLVKALWKPVFAPTACLFSPLAGTKSRCPAPRGQVARRSGGCLWGARCSVIRGGPVGGGGGGGLWGCGRRRPCPALCGGAGTGAACGGTLIAPLTLSCTAAIEVVVMALLASPHPPEAEKKGSKRGKANRLGCARRARKSQCGEGELAGARLPSGPPVASCGQKESAGGKSTL